MVAELFERGWNGRYLDEVTRFCADTIAIQSVRLRRAMGVAGVLVRFVDDLQRGGRQDIFERAADPVRDRMSLFTHWKLPLC